MKKTKFAPRHFVRDIVLVFALLAAGIVAAVVFFSVQSRGDISQRYIDNAAAGAAREFESMSHSMTQSIELVADWVGSGKASLDKIDELDGLLFPVLKRDQLLHGIAIADNAGRSYYLTDDGDGWRTSQTNNAKDGRNSIVRLWDADQHMTSEKASPSKYDARKRPWFSPALSSDKVCWTQPYPFFERREVGITASIAPKKEAGGETVVAFDILLDKLFLEIQRIEPSKNSRVFILRRDAQLFVPGAGQTASQFRPPAQIKDQLVRKMVASWNGKTPITIAPFSIRHDNETWWCGVRPVDGAEGKVWVGIMIPESDIIGGINQRRMGIWFIGGIAILLAGGLAYLMIRRYGHSFEEGPEEQFDNDHPEESIRRLIAKGEGRTIEFKSTMRMNLHTQKPGKEIETAWLKAVAAFMNTDGGTLLIGVADDGEPLGLEADAFANEDKCRLHFKNLINQHIGVELSKYVHLELVLLDGKQIGVVSCSRSLEPVYLKTGKDEAFYIRSGPSSDALPVSKVVAYIQNRK